MQRILISTAAMIVLAASASAQQMIPAENPLDPATSVTIYSSPADQDIACEACLALYKQIKDEPSRIDETQELNRVNGCLTEFPGLPGEEEAVTHQ